jgi:transposase
MGTTVDTVGGSDSGKRQPNYPADFKHSLPAAVCKPGVSVSKLVREHWINANMLFRWRRDLHASLLRESKSRSAHLVPVVGQRAPALPAFPSTSSSPFLEIGIADAVSASALAPTPRCCSLYFKVCTHDRRACWYQYLA